MSFLRRRSAATPAGPDFDVLAMDPGDWPGNLGAGLLPVLSDVDDMDTAREVAAAVPHTRFAAALAHLGALR